MKTERAPAKCMPIRDEELIQFLLGEADAAMRCRIEASLACDPQVVQRLQELRAALGLLDSLKSSVEPPEDLVSRTMQRIADADASECIDSKPLEREPVEVQRPSNSVEGPTVAGSARHLSSVTGRRVRSGSSVWDSAVFSVSIVLLASLLLPLVLQARYESRRAQCAHNLKTLGEGLTQIAQSDPGHRFPGVPMDGLYAFAGVFTVHLNDAGLLPSLSHLQCVSLPASDRSGSHILCVPSSSDFMLADEAQRALWRAELGGDYAYNLGVLEHGRVVGPRLQGRTYFPILSDAPLYEDDHEVFRAHEGRGVNMYFEDGHVAFVYLAQGLPSAVVPTNVKTLESPRNETPLLNVDSWSRSTDHPFRNIQGEHAAGLMPDDAALGPSSSTPRPTLIRSDAPRLR